MRKPIRVLNCAIVTVLCCIFFSDSHALNEPTHEVINEFIARNTLMDFSLNQYLQESLYWNLGVNDDLGGKKVWEWLREGRTQEDWPVFRSFNHYHDPTRAWDVAGLWGGNLGRSSIVWAQTPDQPWGFFSWGDVRNYFYSALTSTAQNNSKQLFAKAFRGLGQLMHLVQDASVPLHTRNDIHIIPGHFPDPRNEGQTISRSSLGKDLQEQCLERTRMK